MATASKALDARASAAKTARRKAPATKKAAGRPAAKVASPAPRRPARKTSVVRKNASAGAGRPAKAAREIEALKAIRAIKADKLKKPKLVRDSFTIPKTEYLVLEDLKQRAARAGSAAKKSELLRAGIKALAGMDDAAFLKAMRAVPPIKTGRPAGSQADQGSGDRA